MTRREKERNKGLKEVHGTVDKQSRAVDKLHCTTVLKITGGIVLTVLGLKTDWLVGKNTII